MNKRIELLVDQVDRIKDMYNVGPVQKAAIEDFAELIVKETLDQVNETMELTWPAMQVKIKQYFGVE
jgi:hypothetical protein